MSDDSQRPIIVKKINKGHGGHHGGAWKIAYADFVTAMMAFFLLMWLLGSVSKGKLSGISDYFNTPLKVALQGGDSTGNATSIIPGGGQDLQRISGEVSKGQDSANDDAKKAKQAAEKMMFDKLREKVQTVIEQNPELAKFKDQLLIDMTPEGLRIQLVDEQNRPMFDSGSAKLQPYTVQLLRDLGKLLNEVPNRISLSGHTDAVQYSSGDRGYSNWELSAERANTSRREMIAGGLQDGKVLRVVGLGSAVPLDDEHPDAPINRRISIIVLNEETTTAIMKNSGKSDPAAQQLLDQAQGASSAP